jgi:hypothetical protein
LTVPAAATIVRTDDSRPHALDDDRQGRKAGRRHAAPQRTVAGFTAARADDLRADQGDDLLGQVDEGRQGDADDGQDDRTGDDQRGNVGDDPATGTATTRTTASSEGLDRPGPLRPSESEPAPPAFRGEAYPVYMARPKFRVLVLKWGSETRGE